MRTIKLWLLTIAVLLCSISAHAHDFEVDGIYYSIISHDKLAVGVTHKGSSTSSAIYSGNVAIPKCVVYNGCTYSVTSVGNYAFYGCSGLASITIPNSVTSIGVCSFYGCSGLACITIPSSVTSIGGSAFQDCSGLTNITIPSSVTSIGVFAFQNCSSLTNITIPNSVTSIERGAFGNTPWYAQQPYGAMYVNDVLYEYKGAMPANTSIEIKEGTISISSAAFSGCSNLTNITIPNSVTSIGESAFRSCSGLTSITIPNSVTSIGEASFYGCSGLTSITIPNSVTSVGNYAFYGCRGLTNITIPNSVTSIGEQALNGTPWYFAQQSEGVIYVNDVLYEYKGEMPANTSIEIKEGTISISPAAFYGCSNLTNITIPNSVTSIGGGAFQACRGLTNITIPNSVTSIGKAAFYGCSGLTNITIPNSVTSIGDRVFEDCRGLTSITIPNSVTSIGSRAFYNCSGLTSITIPNPVKSIEDETFYNCSNLTSITIPNSVTSVGKYAFYDCSGLTNITISNSVTSIGVCSFYGCSGLANITIPNSVAYIEAGAFIGCSGLTSITIPNSVTYIEMDAFGYCSSLKSVRCSSLIPPICHGQAFRRVNVAECTLEIPEEAIDAYTAAAPWNNFNIVGVKEPREITLIDGESYEVVENDEFSRITYTRTLNNTEWNALYLPFEIPVSQLTDKYEVAYINAIHSYDEDDNGEIDRMSMEVIKLREGTLHANHPYLIKARTAAAKQMSITVENTTLYKAESRTLDCSSVYTKFEITGIYEKMTSAQLAGCYALSGGSWKNLSSGSSLNPFRLYLRVSSREGSPVKLSEAALARIGIHVQGEETATSVEERLMQKQHKANAVYDLSGRRITSPKKGQTYIVNGKKRMY